MSFLLWLLPDSFVTFAIHAIVIVGLLSYIFIDAISKYFSSINIQYLKFVSIIVFSYGFYLEGTLSATKVWQDKVEIIEKKLKDAEEKSKVENVKIVTEYKTKTKIVEKKGKDIIQYIDREIVKYDDTCKIPKEFIDIHNKAIEVVK